MKSNRAVARTLLMIMLPAVAFLFSNSVIAVKTNFRILKNKNSNTTKKSMTMYGKNSTKTSKSKNK